MSFEAIIWLAAFAEWFVGMCAIACVGLCLDWMIKNSPSKEPLPPIETMMVDPIVGQTVKIKGHGHQGEVLGFDTHDDTLFVRNWGWVKANRCELVAA